MLDLKCLAEEVASDPSEHRLTSRLVKYWKAVREAQLVPARHQFRLNLTPDLESLAFGVDLTDKPPVIRHMGAALRQEAGCDPRNKPITSVPPGTLVGWVVENIATAIEKRRPVSFEFEFNNSEYQVVKVRSTLLPFSDDDRQINYVIGVITFKKTPLQSSLTKH